MNNAVVSVVIVHYKVKNLLFKCLESLYETSGKEKVEVIVVDNDEKKLIRLELLKKFPNARYIANKNRGYGQGNNVGAKNAKGEFLFFLNPDCIVLPGAVREMTRFLRLKSRIGVVAPLLLDTNNKPYPLQGTKQLSPLRAIFGLSLLNKLFPKNPIAKEYWQTGWDKNKNKEIDVVPGTAFMISKKLFNKVGGFDENFFLYFEEYDFCKRVSDMGYKLFITPKAKVIHFWGESTKKSNLDIKKIFNQSRFYYFKKHYGLTNAFLVSFALGINKQCIVLILIFLVFIVLVIYRINVLMTFIGDQGWFYLSARNIFIFGDIPLVGIASSHPWLHQGPLWTYMLAPFLYFSKWNPVGGVMLGMVFGLASIFISYRIGKEFFTERLAIIYSILLATSPLVVFHARMPYHTTPIPFFVLLLMYSLIKWVQGNVIFFPMIFLAMSILYNLHLGTVIFWPLIILLIIIGYYRKENYFQKLKNKKILLISLLALIIPMIPVIIYDLNNGFPQTIKYGAWYVYKFLQLISVFEKSPLDNTSYLLTFNFFLEKYSLLTIPVNKIFAFFLLTISVFILFIKSRTDAITSSFNIILLITAIGLISFFASNVPSEAYLVLLFPGLIFFFAYVIFQLPKPLSLFAVIVVAGFNIFFLISSNFLMYEGLTLEKRKNAAKQILTLSEGYEYNILFRGPGEEFESTTMNYEYLIWWLGRSYPSDENENLRIIIKEIDHSEVKVEAIY